MEQKNELKAYKFDVTSLKKDEDGKVSDERDTLVCGYAFEGDPSPYIEYNDYWNFGDGRINLISKDGLKIESSINSMIEVVYYNGIQGVDIRKMLDGLNVPGRWAEVCLGNDVKTTLRVTRLSGLPEIDLEASVRNSDMSPSQQRRVKINGVPLFPEGETINASNPTKPTMVFRPELSRELGNMWEELIRVRCGAIVNVTSIPTHNSINYMSMKLKIKAPTREDLDSALCAIGVLHPQDVEPDLVEGEGSEPTGFTATVILTTEV